MIRLDPVGFFNKLREARGLLGRPDPRKASFADEIAGVLGGVAGSKLVDIGCGSADLGCFLQDLGACYTGIDLRRVAAASDRLNLHHADARTVAQRPDWAARFDIGLLIDVVGYGREPDRELLAASRKLIRDRGLLYLDWPGEPPEPAGMSTDETADFSFRLRWQYDKPTRLQRVSPELLYQDRCYTIGDDDGSGYPLLRYLYPVQEMTELLTATGFWAIDAPPSEDSSYVRLIATAG